MAGSNVSVAPYLYRDLVVRVVDDLDVRLSDDDERFVAGLVGEFPDHQITVHLRSGDSDPSDVGGCVSSERVRSYEQHVGSFGTVCDLSGCFPDHLAWYGHVFSGDHHRCMVLSSTAVDGVDGFPGEQLRRVRPRFERTDGHVGVLSPTVDDVTHEGCLDQPPGSRHELRPARRRCLPTGSPSPMAARSRP